MESGCLLKRVGFFFFKYLSAAGSEFLLTTKKSQKTTLFLK